MGRVNYFIILYINNINGTRKIFQKNTQTKKMTISKRAGLSLAVPKTKKYLAVHGTRANTPASIFTTAVVEYITAEILELSSDQFQKKKSSGHTYIKPSHIANAIKSDEELSSLFYGLQMCNVPRMIVKKSSTTTAKSTQ